MLKRPLVLNFPMQHTSSDIRLYSYFTMLKTVTVVDTTLWAFDWLSQLFTAQVCNQLEVVCLRSPLLSLYLCCSRYNSSSYMEF